MKGYSEEQARELEAEAARQEALYQHIGRVADQTGSHYATTVANNLYWDAGAAARAARDYSNSTGGSEGTDGDYDW